MPASPSVSVLLPVLNEEDHIDDCLASLAAQDYPAIASIIVAEGGSTDGTARRLEAWAADLPTLRVIPNPDRVQSAGINRAAAVAEGEVLVRADAHTTYEPDYVRRSVEILTGGGVSVAGGPMRPRGESRFGRAVAAAMSSPFTTGPGRFHREDGAGPADTVYLGAFRREEFLDLGGLRTFPSGAGEDAELYHRWRRLRGGVVMLDPSIRSTYRPRETPRALWRQHLRYGQAKTEMLWANGVLPTWRPAAPAALLVALAATGILAAAGGPWWPFAAVVAGWLAVILVAAIPTGRLALPVVLAAMIMHLAFGLGLLWGLVRGPGAVRRPAAQDP